MDGSCSLIPCDGIEYDYGTQDVFIDISKVPGWKTAKAHDKAGSVKVVELVRDFKRSYPDLVVRHWIIRGDR